MRRTRILAAALLLGVLLPGPGQAQSALPPDIPEDATRKVGPVYLFPRFEVTSIGVDSNVFNEAAAPRSDFSIVFRPALDAHTRVGIGRISYRSWVDAVYFQKYSNERALNRFGEVRGELRFSRFVPFVTVAGLETSDRPNGEIDLRADRTVSTYGSGVSVAMLSRTALVASIRRQTASFDAGQIYQGVDLAQQLNSTTDTIEGSMRVALSDLTTFSVVAARERNEFDLSPERDSTSFRVTPRFDFDAAALLSGYAALGFRQFDPDSALLPAYRGLAGDIGVAYSNDSLRIALRAKRDVDYSYQEEAPYFLNTAVSVSVTRQIAGPFDIQVTASRDKAEYTQFSGALDVLANPGVERMYTIGSGIGYRFRDSARLGITYEHSERDAGQIGRPYNRNRVFGSVVYGF